MYEPRNRDNSRSTLRLGFLLAALVWAMAAASYALAAEPQWSLAVGTASAAPQTAVEVPVVLTSRGAAVSAIAFTIEFDSAKLALDGGPTLGSKVEIPAPTMFTSSSWVGTEAGRIGVAVYDPTRPIGTLGDGTIARVRFRALAGSSGFAFVRVSTTRPFSASGPRGERLDGEITPGGGITIEAPAGSTETSADPRGPRERLRTVERSSPELASVVVPLLSADDAEGNARWHTSLFLHNGGESRATARITMLRERADAAPAPVEVSIPAGATRSWSDAGAELFGVPSARGALLIDCSSDRILASGSAGSGRVEGAPAGSGEARLVALSARSELTIANLEEGEARFVVELRDGEGALVGSNEIVVAPRSVSHRIEMEAAAAPRTGPLTAIIRPREAGRYLAWSTAIEAGSSPALQIAR